MIKSRYSKYAKRPRRKVGKMGGVAALARKVNGLLRARRSAAQWLNMNKSITNTSLAQVTAYNCCEYSAMTPIFGTSAEDLLDPKVLYHSSKLQIRLSLENTNNEEETTRFSVFLVSLKDRVPQSKFNNSTGVLTLVGNQDYVINQGIAYINKKIFNIHKAKYFTLTNYGTALGTAAGQSQFGTAHEFSWNIAPRMTIEHPAGNWSALASSLDPSKQYYVLVFTDNQTGDLEYPALTINQMVNFKKIAPA